MEDDNNVVKIPTWIKLKTTTQPKKRFTNTDSNKSSKRTRRPDRRVENPDKDAKCLLRPDEDFKTIFHPICKHGMDPPQQNDGNKTAREATHLTKHKMKRNNGLFFSLTAGKIQ